MRALLWLVGGTVAFWGLLTYPSRLVWPDDPTFAWNTAAALLCLVPGVLTLAWTTWAYGGQAQQQLVAVLGSTMVRMLVVIAGSMVLFLSVKEFEYQRFWMFVIVYYLFTLALEMVLIVRGASAKEAPSKN
jgi:hypothetical protein